MRGYIRRHLRQYFINTSWNLISETFNISLLRGFT